MPYVLRIGGIVVFLIAAWSSVDWVSRAAGPGHTPAVVVGVVAGLAAIVAARWHVRQFRAAQQKRDWRRISLLLLVGVAAVLAFAATGAVLTGYDGAGGGATSTSPPPSTPAR